MIFDTKMHAKRNFESGIKPMVSPSAINV